MLKSRQVANQYAVWGLGLHVHAHDWTFSMLCIVCVGLISGHKVVGVRMILEDGVSHPVDSSELAFKLAAIGALRQGTLFRILDFFY